MLATSLLRTNLLLTRNSCKNIRNVLIIYNKTNTCVNLLTINRRGIFQNICHFIKNEPNTKMRESLTNLLRNIDETNESCGGGGR